MVAQLSTSNDVILPDDIILAGENPSNSLKEAAEPLMEAVEPLRKKHDLTCLKVASRCGSMVL